MPPKPDKPFTSAIWTVKEGKGSEFVTAWLEFAKWTKENFPGAEMAYLLQDQERPDVYLTMGPGRKMIDGAPARSSNGSLKGKGAVQRHPPNDAEPGRHRHLIDRAIYSH